MRVNQSQTRPASTHPSHLGGVCLPPPRPPPHCSLRRRIELQVSSASSPVLRLHRYSSRSRAMSWSGTRDHTASAVSGKCRASPSFPWRRVHGPSRRCTSSSLRDHTLPVFTPQLASYSYNTYGTYAHAQRRLPRVYLVHIPVFVGTWGRLVQTKAYSLHSDTDFWCLYKVVGGQHYPLVFVVVGGQHYPLVFVVVGGQHYPLVFVVVGGQHYPLVFVVVGGQHYPLVFVVVGGQHYPLVFVGVGDSTTPWCLWLWGDSTTPWCLWLWGDSTTR